MKEAKSVVIETGGLGDEIIEVANDSSDILSFYRTLVKQHLLENALRKKLAEIKELAITHDKRIGTSMMHFPFVSYKLGHKYQASSLEIMSNPQFRACDETKIASAVHICDIVSKHNAEMVDIVHKAKYMQNSASVRLVKVLNDKFGMNNMREIAWLVNSLEIIGSATVMTKGTNDSSCNIAGCVNFYDDALFHNKAFESAIKGSLVVDIERELFYVIAVINTYKNETIVVSDFGSIYLSVGLTLTLEQEELPTDFYFLCKLLEQCYTS